MNKCRHCNCEIILSRSEVKNRKYICKECRREKEKSYRAEHKQKRYPASPAKIKADRRYYRSPRGKSARHRQYEKAKLDPLWSIRNKARDAVRRALDRGDMKRRPCEKCGSEKAEAHHEDYAKPLEVKWLCRRHHIQAHGHRNVTT